MKIAIYKPFKETFFHDDTKDNAAWSYEVVNCARILVEHGGHEVYILSETDLMDGIIPGIFRGDVEDTYDRTIIWSGTFNLDPLGDSVIKKLRARTDRLDFILTDFALLPEDHALFEEFDNIYTMASRPIPGIGGVYGGLAELRAYHVEFRETIPEVISRKRTEFYFGGTERKRLADFLEYVWRPGHVITTKSAFLGIENRVDRDEYFRLLDDAKYSICIADEQCNDNYFMSPRPYEYFAHDIICFTDMKFDPDFKLIPQDSWLRVSNYKEMREKMWELNDSPEKHEEMLAWQRSQLTPDKVDGSFVYDRLK